MIDPLSPFGNLSGLNGSGLALNQGTVTNFQYTVITCNPENIFAVVILALVIMLFVVTHLSGVKIKELNRRLREYEEQEDAKREL